MKTIILVLFMGAVGIQSLRSKTAHQLLGKDSARQLKNPQ